MKYSEKEIREDLGEMADILSLQSFQDIKTLVHGSYERGFEDAKEGFKQDEITKEKIGVEYASEAFKECHTLEDFQDKLREINNRVCNFMPIIG